MSYEIKKDDSGMVVYEAIEYEDGQVLEAEHMNRIEAYLEDIYGVLNAKPEIYCESTTLYTSIGSPVYLNFSIKTRGDASVTVRRGVNGIYHKKTSEKQFHILVDANPTQVQTVEYTITVEDNQSNTTEVKIINQIIDAKLMLSAPINDNHVIIGYNPNSSATLDLTNSLIFSISGEQPSSYELYYRLNDKNWNAVEQSAQINSSINTYTYTYDLPKILLGDNITNDSSGTITFQVRYTLKDSIDIISVNFVLTYDLIQYGTIKFIALNDINGFTSNDKFSINYKVLAPEIVSVSSIRAKLTNELVVEQAMATINTSYTLSFGMLPAGDYTIQWYVNNELKDQTSFTIIEGASYVDNGFLLAYFNAAASTSATEWKPVEGSLKNDIQFNLYGGYTWNEATLTTPNNLLLVPNSYGLLNNYEILANELDKTHEFSLELYFYATNIGELKAPVFTTLANNNDTVGLNILHDSAQILNAGTDSISTLLNNKWNHVVLEVVNGTDINPKANIEDTEYYKCFKIYLNGCLINCTYLTEEFQWLSQFGQIQQFVLNGYLNTEKQLRESGQTQYELIRIYNKALSASEVLLNYKNAIAYNENLLKEVTDRNNNTSIAKIFFIKNKTPNENEAKIRDEKGYIDFSTLHTITKKKKENDDETGYFSKTSAVNCSVFLIQNNLITKYPNMDVLLQGTSSLVYPIKNYQIKNYNNQNKKQAFLPNVSDINLDTGADWGGVDGDYVYTLKCDYMEQSHKNNTPTAIYYENVLDNIVGNNTEAYSPARKVINEDGIAPYRDSITGFPVLVYYSDNNNDNIDLSQYTETTAGLEQTLISNCIPTGSYMFNIDKEGKALGFELEDISEDEEIFNFALKDYYINTANIAATENSSELSNIIFDDSLSTTSVDELNEQKLHLYCYGYVYKKEGDDKTEYTDQQCWLRDCGEVQFSTLNTLTVNYNLTGLIPFCLSKIEEITRPTTGYCMSLEGTANSQDYAAATFYTVNDANKQREQYNSQEGILDKDKLALFEDKFAYYTATLEPRYSYADELKYKDIRLRACEYEQLDECIKFFKIVDINAQKSDDDNTKITDKALRQRFEQLFSKEYCLTYYLQMMMFTQVDNAGKNAMFDSWNGGKLYPRPYDMDTQMGLDNVGADNIPVSAELFDSSIKGTAELSVNVNYRYKDEGKALDLNEQRLTSYNTRNSRLWDFVRLKYKQDIINHYKNLRMEIYTENYICNTINNLTSNIISESQYNQDAVLKYLLPPKEEVQEDGKIILKPQIDYFYVLAGNRVDRYRQYIRQRLIFLDSVYEQGNYINYINMRAEASSPLNTIKWNFSSFSPQYISIVSGQNTPAFKFYVTPEMSYLIKDDIYGEGVELSFLNTSTNRETTIYGVNNLKFINNLGSAVPSTITGLANAVKLNSFDLQNAPTQLTEIDLSNNTMLNNVNISNCQGITSLKLANATNLKEISITNNEKLISLTLPTSAPLTKIDLTNSKNLQSLTLTNLPNLTTENLDLTGCVNLTSLTIENCPLLENIALTDLPKLSTVILNKCSTLETFECIQHANLYDLTIKNCNALKTVILRECKKLEILNLQEGNDNINQVDLSNVENLRGLVLPKNSEVENGFSLDMTNCKQCLTINSATEGEYDFADMKLTSLKLASNHAVKEIKNLNYHGSGSQIFYECKNLSKIDKSTLTFCSSMKHAFAYDSQLTISDDTTFSMDGDNPITSAYMMFFDCQKMNVPIPRLLETFIYDNTSLTSLGYGFASYGQQLNSWVLDASRFKSNLTNLLCAFSNSKLRTINNTFSKASGLTNVAGCFSSNQLTNIPDNLFAASPLINQAHYCFYSNTSLSSLPTNLFSQSNESQTINAASMFEQCDLSNANIKNFFIANSKMINNADAMFRKTNISAISSGIFNNIPNLKSAIGIFADCNNITSIQDLQLRTDSSTTLAPERLNLGGLFYNCTNLGGLIPAQLFTNLKSCIVSLGWEGLRSGVDNSNLTKMVLGAFANTAIEGYEIETFQNMAILKNISYLFAAAVVTPNSSISTAFTITNTEQRNQFQGYGVINGQSPNGVISYNIFKNCPNISLVYGVFMGTQVKTIGTDPTNKLLFGDNQTKITNIQNLFNNSTLESCDGLNVFLQNCPAITSARYTFANTLLNILSEDFFEKNTKLKDIQGVFAQCQRITDIPINLLKPFKHNLETASYAFAYSGIQAVPEVRPETYALDIDWEINFYHKENEENIIQFGPNTAADRLINKQTQQAVKNIMVNQDLKIEIQYMDNTVETLENTQFDDIVLKFKIANNNQLNSANYYKLYGSYLTDSQSKVQLFVINKTDLNASKMDEYYCITLGTNNNYNLQLISLYKQIVTSVDNSLFYDCTNLIRTKGCFMGTEIDTIPNYMFASDQALEALTNTSYMFANCKKVINSSNIDSLDSTDPELFSMTLLEKCPAITDIEGMYSNLGADMTEQEDVSISTYKLGNAFNQLQKLTNIQIAFANIPILLQNTTLNNGFLFNSLSTLTSCNYAFAATRLKQISEVFNGDLVGNNITSFNYAFAYCVKTTEITPPYFNRFPKTCKYEDAWVKYVPEDQSITTTGIRTELSQRNWPNTSYHVGNGYLTSSYVKDLQNKIQTTIDQIAYGYSCHVSHTNATATS